MFKFERQIKVLKGMIRNTRYPVASMAKNYLIDEMICVDIALSLPNISALDHFLDNASETVSSTIRDLISGLSSLKYIDGKIHCSYDADNRQKSPTFKDIDPNLITFLTDDIWNPEETWSSGLGTSSERLLLNLQIETIYNCSMIYLHDNY
mmetsp:Transcript_25773/g.38153  ORF Transcript_25773/g.38153 Transcript_25773/m.38153 type:complete len:151 (+) Transcript_25773:1376-1828(+)